MVIEISLAIIALSTVTLTSFFIFAFLKIKKALSSVQTEQKNPLKLPDTMGDLGNWIFGGISLWHKIKKEVNYEQHS